MDIGVSVNGYWTLDAEAMRAVITGKVIWRKCFECDKGAVWVDGDLGIQVPESECSENDDLRYYKDQCEECLGVGFILVCAD